jgi:hypothetical protein
LEDSEPLDENQPRKYYQEDAEEASENNVQDQMDHYQEGVEDSEQDSADSIEEEDFAECLEPNNFGEDGQEYVVNIPLINVVNSNYH